MTDLRKYMTHGLLAVASIGAVLTLSEATKAFTVGDFVNNPNFTFTVGDKTFSNFGYTGTTVDLQDEITIGFVGGVYQLNYSAAPLPNLALTTPGTFSYKVTIPDSFTNVFDMVGTNGQGSTFPGAGFTKSLAETNLIGSPIVSTSATGTVFGNFTPGVKVINVTSAWTLQSPTASFLNGFSDQYVQNPANPTPVANIPEPSGVLGLVALGLAGLVSRAASKSLGK